MEIFEICIYRKYWKNGINWDALSEKWSDNLNWGNIPISHVRVFLIKALIEFLKGKNVNLLLTTNQLVNKDIYKDYFEEIVSIKDLGYVKFFKNGEPIKKPYPQPCCLVSFLQPSYID